MAKKPTKAADEAADEAGDLRVEPAALPASGEATTTVRIVSKREMQVGDRVRQAGELLATIELEHEVTLPFLLRAATDDFCGPAAE